MPLHLPLFPLASPRPPHILESTQDLISRFHLLTAYDKFVRPFITQDHDSNTTHPPTTPAVASSPDKGKGRERDPGTPTIASAATPGTHLDPDDDEGRDGKKKKNTYRHLIKGVPGICKSPSSLPTSLTLLTGKHSIKKDDFLSTIIQVPPKQHIPITPFDSRTQADAFTVSLEGLKGVCYPNFLFTNLKLLQWNIHALVPESTQAREDRKKRVRATLVNNLRLVKLISLSHPFAERTQKVGKSTGLCCPTFSRHSITPNSCRCADALTTTCSTTTHEHSSTCSSWRQTRV